ncbi:hypothetical protein [Rudaeicoccus suwonensis]|uniref:Uncharacterized protein n=1 Tax=Rudaeicoccus suwonensis TaxID=657409 RepID=A0A561EBT6_9MICO|nr:hypothetical protein [Rudaeicoccus suwonensis]TWE13073.1 hypothetical protein BKA23_1901 [Rudaeicoccus suwonensis]
MSTEQTRPTDGGHRSKHDDPQADRTESLRHLLAIHDPSKRTAGRDPRTAADGHGVTVQWVRPTDLAARVAARASAGAVAAHVAAHRQVREHVRARLAPLSAFGRQTEGQAPVAARSVIGH